MSPEELVEISAMVTLHHMKRETELYGPVKSLLEAQGYEVKGEIGAADLVALRGAEAPLIVELKLRFSLSLFHQAVARQSISELIYIAVPRGSGKAFLRSLKENISLCRRLGLGLITVRGRDGFCEVHCDPGPYAPRKSKAKKARLLREFARRVGDPNQGGATRHGIVTGYRQDALRCATYLAEYGASGGAAVARDTGVRQATRIMAANHYGWFERAARGVYTLTAKGQTGLTDWSDAV